MRDTTTSIHRFKATALPFAVALAAGLLMLALVISPRLAAAQDQRPNASTQDERPTLETVPGQIIVKFREGANSATRAEARHAIGLEKNNNLELIDAEVDRVRGQSVELAIEALERRPDVLYAEPDYINRPLGYADEPRFSELWGLDNTGQSVGGVPGIADADINAREASAITQGDPNLVVAVIDTGVDFSHPDLADRAWKNPGESGGGKETNGVDDDNNGYVDDVNGWDFCHNDKTVYDPGEFDFHGTHVSGTIAASVNGQGVVGVAPNVQVTSLKFLGPFPCGANSDAIEALGYAKSKGIKISNNSWGGAPYDQALKDAIEASGQIFVAAAANGGWDGIGDDNDVFPIYPASYNSTNILSVAAIDNQGNLASFSNYGATTVDISAPGVNILSTFPGGSWQYLQGTSMATPHVTGVAALAASKSPGLLSDPTALKRLIMDSGKPVSATAGKTVTGDMADAMAVLLPRVTNVFPADGARGVPRTTNIVATFSENMAPDTFINGTTIELVKAGTSTPVPATVSCDDPCRTVTLDPSVTKLARKTTYTVTIEGEDSGVKSSAGTLLDADKIWSFKTKRR